MVAEILVEILVEIPVEIQGDIVIVAGEEIIEIVKIIAKHDHQRIIIMGKITLFFLQNFEKF